MQVCVCVSAENLCSFCTPPPPTTAQRAQRHAPPVHGCFLIKKSINKNTWCRAPDLPTLHRDHSQRRLPTDQVVCSATRSHMITAVDRGCVTGDVDDATCTNPVPAPHSRTQPRLCSAHVRCALLASTRTPELTTCADGEEDRGGAQRTACARGYHDDGWWWCAVARFDGVRQAEWRGNAQILRAKQTSMLALLPNTNERRNNTVRPLNRYPWPRRQKKKRCRAERLAGHNVGGASRRYPLRLSPRCTGSPCSQKDNRKGDRHGDANILPEWPNSHDCAEDRGPDARFPAIVPCTVA